MKKLIKLVFACVLPFAGLAIDKQYGTFGTDADVRMDQVSPTMLEDVKLSIYEEPMAVGDCVALYRVDDQSLCGLGEVVALKDGTPNLTISINVSPGTKIHFKVWRKATGDTYDCDDSCDYTLSSIGGFISEIELTVTATFIVNFNANGGEGLMDDQMFTNGVAQALATNTFALTGYTFEGWATNETGEVVYRDGQNVTMAANMELFAQWKQRKIWYVDALNGRDENSGISIEGPLASIQKAVDMAQDGDEIIVNDGYYEPIATKNKRVIIHSVNGPTNTIIDASLQWSRGITNRCARLYGDVPGKNTVLSGIALINGIALADGLGGGGALGGTLTNCVIAGCMALEGGGACMSTLVDCLLYRNAAYNGGGVNNCILNACDLYENEAYHGGGSDLSNAEDCNYLQNSAVLNPNSSSGYGGGANDGTLIRCYFAGNTALCGGAVAYGTVVQCTLETNSASSHGGGSYVANLRNCLLVGNDAALYGGGAYRGTLKNCTVVDNSQTTSSGKGGGAYDATLVNCIVWGNQGYGGDDDISIDGYVPASSSYCCSGSIVDGTGNICVDPCFRDAASGDYRLKATSPCINRGDNSVVEDADDLDGDIRIRDEVVDMGAYECDLQQITPKWTIVDGVLTAVDLNGCTDVVIPDGVTRIDDRVFYNCGGLRSVMIPEGVSEIGNYAFARCTALMSVTMFNSVVSVGSCTFRDCTNMTDVVISDNLMGIGYEMFAGCSELLRVTIPDAVTNIGNSAFYACSRLAHVIIPDNVVNIDAGAFSSCTGIVSMAIGSNVVNIGRLAFYGCSGLTSIRIPSSVTNIGTIAFAGCDALTNVTFDGNAPAAAPDTFNGRGTDCTVHVKYGTTGWGVDIPGTWNGMWIEYYDLPPVTCTVTFDARGGEVVEMSRAVTNGYAVGELPEVTWDGHTFDGWFTASNGGSQVSSDTVVTTNVTFYAHWTTEPMPRWTIVDGVLIAVDLNDCTDVTIPDGVESIGDEVFRDCGNLTSVTIPDSVTSIGDRAFKDCGSLTNVTIGTGLAEIQGGVFNGCTNIADIVIAEGNENLSMKDGVLYVLPRKAVAFILYGATSAIIKDGTEVIDSGVFSGMSRLSSVKIPDSVREIGFIGYEASPEAFQNEGGMFTCDGWIMVIDREKPPLALDKLVNGEQPSGTLDFTRFRGIANNAFDLFMNMPPVYMRGYSFSNVYVRISSACHVGMGAFDGWNDVHIERIDDVWTVSFDANGGEGTMMPQAFTNGVEQALATNIFARIGHTFAGWATNTPGTVVYTNGQSVFVSADMTLYALWKTNVYNVKFDANGGSGSMPNQRFVYDTPQNLTANGFTKTNHVFVGWALSTNGEIAYEDGQSVINLSANDNGVVTLFAVWEETLPPDPDWPPELWPNVGGQPIVACVYDGYLYDDAGNLKGTIQVKLGKWNDRTKTRTARITVVALDGTKKTYKLKAGDNKESTGDNKGGMTVYSYALTGEYHNYKIMGARNMFSSKIKGEAPYASWMAARWPVVNMAWEGGTMTALINKKGKVKVTCNFMDGTKITVTSQLIVGREWSCVPVVYAKKGVNLAFVLWLPKNDGSAAVTSLADAVVGKPGTLKGGAKFQIDADAFAARWGQRALPYLPDGLAVGGGAKWTLPKAGKVVYRRGSTEVDEVKLGENPSALKLTYKAKDGSFKGSFKAYADANGKPKATTVNVTGVLIDGVGYGAATIKKVGGVPVKVE